MGEKIDKEAPIFVIFCPYCLSCHRFNQTDPTQQGPEDSVQFVDTINEQFLARNLNVQPFESPCGKHVHAVMYTQRMFTCCIPQVN